MPQSTPARRRTEATRDFRRAWKLLGRLEARLGRLRANEARRLRQLAEASVVDTARRAGQLESARADIVRVEGYLTELSDLIAVTARARSGQTVKDMAHAIAIAIHDEAAAAGPSSIDATPLRWANSMARRRAEVPGARRAASRTRTVDSGD